MDKQTSFTATRWITLALASGTFAALNGLFAKLTTTAATSSIAHSIAHALNFPDSIIEALVRAACFALNIFSNITMWALFTRALTAAPSTTKVSITNTAANFLVTAVLGMIVFGEKVGGLWWIGAGMMGAGCVLVGMREGENTNSSGKDKGEEEQEEEEDEEEGEEEEEVDDDDDDYDEDEDDEQESGEDAPLVPPKRTTRSTRSTKS